MNDESIIDLYFARDERAIAESERRYGTYCMTVSMNILGRKADAEECVNETWLRTWNSIPPTRPDSLRAWFGRLTRNLSLTRLQSRRHRDTELALDELADCLPVYEEQADDLPALLDGFLETLSDLDCRLFVGRYWYCHPVKTLARVYGMTPNAAELRISRIRERLRKYLNERGYSI